MASARKRPRAEPEDNRAECPFTIKIVDPKDKDQKKKKRRRTEAGDDDDTAQRVTLQMSPFSPSGKFKTHETMDLHYQVEPGKKWTDMTRYNSFVLNGTKYFSEGFIYVANDSSIERQKAVNNNEPVQSRKKSDDDWVARILEIRASDEHHVYARVYWMYWPDELPPGTHDGKKTVQGRQPYHGVNELIASNHMDIINVVSVTSQANVKQWYEENDEEIQNALYWRQAFDVRTYELSSVEMVCSCNTPGNPDKMLVGCTTESCKKWMHEQCIIDDALRATYRRLGTDKPHLPPAPAKKEENEDEGKRPLSPTETGAEGSTEHSIDVKAEAGPSDAVHVSTKDNVDVRQAADDEDAPAAPEDSLPHRPSDQARARATSENTTTTAATDTPGKAAPATGKATSGRRPGRPRKKGAEANGESARPWEGLFEATLKTADVGPPLIEVRDLREGIVGGEKSWTEPVKCLLCGNQVN
ncbi:680fda50-e3d9-40b3-9cff-9576b978825d [Thermothielavioides terrestris]|uniref:BAH domain-containing protein n=2 Tax=Thermothielavioides terrestris TaxID=2587410 RepID=G2R548_THETT|nr:uncharacterized protein THITE_2113995 [Thermothielavioides terrestris NRRL 8126]AEO66131.1 hypothetical protein THITE_2113995 [Thermothielavioides terrestris NRRL 8126]SPQ18609.1 680fda50-e3d9-40b3-9cff-9576b978825d [Thermothielavioides terrestris]